MSMAAITTLFLDLGNVLFTDSWGATLHRRAGTTFSFDVMEVAKRSQLVQSAL